MTGGANAVYSGADVLSETYSVDPWGNMQQSGNFNFQQSYNPANNQINGYSYDAAGDLTGDGMNSYTYDGEGMLTAAGGAQYTYDALQQRIQKTGGSNPEEMIYLNSKPIALYNPSTGAWTDLIWAGSNIIAEVPGSQAATPTWRLLDHEGSLVATTDNSGNINSSNMIAPYGQLMATSTNDPYLYAGLYQDTEYGGDAALYRNYSAEQARWLRPDPYNGSYDLNNPQSFNRYMYVNGNPLTYTDPSGLAGGITGWGGACSLSHKFGDLATTEIGNNSFNFCNPLPYAATYGVVYASYGLYDLSSGTSWSWSATTTRAGEIAGEVVPWIGAALTITCSVDDFSSSVCGPSGWTSAVFTGKNAWVGKGVNDISAVVGAYLCTVGGGPESPGCIGYVIYSVANALFSWAWDLWAPPQFTGSLLPRPSDLGGLGTSPIGIPNQNLGLQQLLGRPLTARVPSPGSLRP